MLVMLKHYLFIQGVQLIHLSSEAMKEGGLTDDMIRLSVGLEDINDIKRL